jgi:hypothetical protein
MTCIIGEFLALVAPDTDPKVGTEERLVLSTGNSNLRM